MAAEGKAIIYLYFTAVIYVFIFYLGLLRQH